jgi:two-component system, response regulator PdtaR
LEVRITSVNVRHVNVLIADADLVARSKTKSLLADIGHSVIAEAESGGQALSLIRSLKPDIVVLDVDLATPLSGIDVARTVSAEHLAPVILVANSIAPDVLATIDTSGAMVFLAKPVRLADLAPNIALARARFEEKATLETSIQLLNERMEARKLVGRAKAILMEKHGLSEREAFYRIQSQSTALSKPSHEIARAIITASELAG